MRRNKQKEQEFKDKIGGILSSLSENFTSEELTDSFCKMTLQIDISGISEVGLDFLNDLNRFLEETAACIINLRQAYTELVEEHEEEPWCDEE